MAIKHQRIIEDESTRKIGFLSRLVNFLEDVYEDAECADLYYTITSIEEESVIVEGVDCNYPLSESIDVFMDKYDLYAEEGIGRKHYTELYDEVVRVYKSTLHYTMKNYAARSLQKHVEYYLGILFSGKAFLVEGEGDKVIIPGGLNQCFAAHTHPSNLPIPSQADVRSITNLFLDRGIGHVIETVGPSLAIYRRAPLSIEDLEVLKTLDRYRSIDELFRALGSLKSITLTYF